MRILHIIFTLNIGGAETMLVDIVNEQCKTDSVFLVVIDESYDERLLRSINPRVQVELLHRKAGSHSIAPFIKLNGFIICQHPDIIHIHNWKTPKVLLPWFRPFFTVHGLRRPPVYYHRLKGIIAISEAVRDDVLSHGNFDVEVIPNGIVVENIPKKDALLAKTFYRIVQTGRLKTELKGQDILIDAMALLRDWGYNNITLDIIGDGESRPEIEAQVERLRLEDRIKLVGAISREDFYAGLKDYDLLCQPSRMEGFGLTVIEAMAARVPVLVSDCGGPYEIIEGGRMGYCFKTNDARSCAEGIKSIMMSYGGEQMLSIVNNAYNKAIEDYSISRMVRSYLHFYAIKS